MRFVYLLFLFFIAVIGLSFAHLNSNSISVDFFLGQEEVPLSILIIFSIAFGAGFAVLAMSFKNLKLRRQLAKANRNLKLTENEVRNLRTLSIKPNH